MTGLHSRSFSAMGTTCSLHLHADEALADAVGARAMLEVGRIEQKYSRYREDSVMAAINCAAEAGGAIAIDGETTSLLDYALACGERSGGLFDITSGLLRRAWDFTTGALPKPDAVAALLPRVGWDKLAWGNGRLEFAVPGMELDFGGIGKEYAVDRLADTCREDGVEAGLVNLGGDLFALGPHPDGTPWRVGLRHPRRADARLGEATLESGGLATSGDYERSLVVDGRRYSHILHPRTGWPVHGLSSVTVIAGPCMVAGSLATIAMLKEDDGAAWLRGMGALHLWADESGRLGGNLGDRFSPDS